MEFCPVCGMLLQIDPGTASHRLRLFCSVCPYVCPIQNKIVKKARLVKKEVEPIFSTADEMKSAPKTAVTCQRCNHGEAYFKQMQIRSADEPMTTIYRCCKEECQHEWRED
ncbi:hypothetical protein BDA96_04G303700 [Sorghum bicolor]|uniref:DNA-directed RNA polymerase subunit n=2 Tax=Sorghum bicolor TaxID=4558 RepID=A0A921UJT4_SORBI|nr:DNA-directed RNA polymerase III subunit RPC10 [Sorghum bicolor]KAG0534718.1 hypothetical protein BDA96_04G303700 [Sorghum bicolor]KXG31022.1 hypothetical protein SORBI_3004G284900 [Sorghum bicolor]|eukprot:XP_002454492.2 DNA-directed RNA polymerase III subunit RPC10 [Sorghum bicolor]